MNNKEDKFSGKIMAKDSQSRLKTFDSFRVPAYRIYFGSMVGNWLTMSMEMMVRSLLIYRLTGSTAIVGGMALAQAIPTLLVSLLGGAIGDRVQKKYILLASRAGLTVVTLGIGLALTMGFLSPERYGSWWLLIIAAALQGSLNSFLAPANTAIIPEIVSEERVMNAISLSSMGQTVFRLIGPALAGYLIDAYDFAIVYYFMAGGYVIATIFTAFLPRTSKGIARGGNPLENILEGLRYSMREPIILIIVAFSALHTISGYPFNQLLPVFTEDILKVSAAEMGLMASVTGAGALLGSLILASLPSRKRGVMLMFTGIIMGLPLVVFSFSHWWYLSLFMTPFVGLGQSTHGALTMTLVQSYSAPDYRARMQSLVMISFQLGGLGTFVAGLLAEAMGVQWAVGGIALFLTLVSIMLLIFATRLRKLE